VKAGVLRQRDPADDKYVATSLERLRHDQEKERGLSK
jgi:hypothetical protein